MKTAGHKSRHGRYRTFPVPHRDHRKRPVYDRFALLRLQIREALAPTVATGLSEIEVSDLLRPRKRLLIENSAGRKHG